MLGLPNYLECVSNLSWVLLCPVFFHSPNIQYFFVLFTLQELLFSESNVRNSRDELLHLLMCSLTFRLSGTRFHFCHNVVSY